MPNWKKVITSGSDALLNEITSSGGIDTTNLDVSGIATYNTVEYSNSNTMKFNQVYYGNNNGTYFTNGEYQKVITITPAGSSENYQVIGRITAQNANETHTVYFNAALRSNTLPNLDWTIYYDEEYNGARYIDPQLWTKQTSTAGFIFAFKTLATIYGNVTVDIDVIPRAASQKANVTFNSVQDSEQASVDSGFTANDMLKVVSKNQTDVNFSAEISSSNITIDDWGSVSASLATLDSTTLQDVTDNGSTTTNNITIDSTGDARLVLDRAANSNDSEIEFKTNGTTNWTIGTGQVGNDNEFTIKGGSTNYVRINESGQANFLSAVTSSDVSIDDWGSVSASLASLDATSNPTLQDVTDNGNTTTNNIVVGQVDGLNPSQNEHIRLKSGSIEFEGTSTTSSVRLTNELTPGGDQNFAIQSDFNQNGFFQDNFSITFEGNSVVEGRSAVQFTVANDNIPTSSVVFTEDTFEFVKDQIGSPWVTITGSKDITIQDWGSVSSSLATLSAFGSPSSPTQGVVAIDGNNVNLGLQSSDSPTFTNLTLSGDLTVNGDTVTLNTSQLHIEDKLISVASGSTTSAQADGAGLHISGANESLTWDNSNTRFKFSDALYTDGGITANGDVDADDVTIDDWGSVSASLASINSDSSNLTLQDVTDNGSTTTNALTINNGTLGATSLHVDGNHQYPLKITSDSLSGDPYMELGGDGIQLVDSVNEDLKIRIGPTGDVNLVARFEYDPISSNRNFAMQGTGSISHYEIIASNTLTLGSPSNANTDTDKFLVLDSGGTVKYRSGAELRSDIGAGSGNGSVTSVGGTGTVSGLSLSGTVTTSGNLTLGGTISIDSSNITDVDAFSQSGTYANLRAQATTKGDVGLGNVENTALSTYTGQGGALDNQYITNGAGYSTTTGTVVTSGTPVANDFARFTDANTIEGRSYSEVRSDLGLEIGTDVDNYGEWHLAGEADSTDVTSGKFVKFTGGQTISGTGTEANPYIMTIVPTTLGTVTSGDVSAILPSGVISGSGQLGIDDTDDVSEGSTNLYYTDARVKTKLDAEGVLSGSNTISGKTLGSNLDSLTVDNTTIELNSGTTYNGGSSKTISAKTGTVANGNTTLVTGDAVYDYVNPISSSLASSISSKPSKYAASGSRMAVWKDDNTVRGFDSLHYFDNGGSDIGIRMNPSSVTGRTIRTGQSGGSSGVQLLITRNPNKTYGATIDYVVFNSLTNRTAYRIGREVSAWDNNGANIVGTGYTSFGFGTLPADLEVSIIESSGEMYLEMTWSGGGTYYISANIDTFGSGI